MAITLLRAPHRIFRPCTGYVCASFALQSYIILQFFEIMETLKFETMTLFYVHFRLDLKSYYIFSLQDNQMKKPILIFKSVII